MLLLPNGSRIRSPYRWLVFEILRTRDTGGLRWTGSWLMLHRMNYRSPITTFMLLAVLFVSGCGGFTTSSVDEEKEPHYLSGKNRLYSYDFEGAKEAFEQSLRVIPESAAAHLELGLLNYKEFENYAEAIHHFQKMLRYRADHPLAEQIADHIEACKMALASEVTLPPANQRIESELKQMIRENQSLTNLVSSLKGQLSKLEQSLRQAQLATRAGTGSVETGNAAPMPQTPSVRPSTARAEAARARQSGPAAGGRSNEPATRSQPMYLKHVLRSGETFYSLAGQYRQTVQAIQKVNPGLRPTALKIGQVVNIPLSQTASTR